MIKFIILCSVIALCMARSLNDNVPVALINTDDIVAESDTSELIKPKDVAASENVAPVGVAPENIAVKDATSEDAAALSDLAAAIDSNSEDIVDSDKTRFLIRFTLPTAATTTTTPLPMMQAINLLLTLNSMAMAG